MTRRGVMLTGVPDSLPVLAIVPWINYDRNTENMLVAKFSLLKHALFIVHINKIDHAAPPVISCQDSS